MALLPLPRRTRAARLSDHRLTREVCGGLPDLPPLSGLADLVAAVEAGAKRRPAPYVPHHRPRHRRAAGVLLLVAAAGALALAYRWWRGRDHTARLLDAPASPGAAPAETPPVPAPVAAPVAGTASAPSISSARQETPLEPAGAQTPGQPHVAPPQSEADAPVSAWTPSTQPHRPQGVASSPPAHPQWRLGRGPSTAPPPVPAARPAIPGRPRPHLPR